MQVWDPLVRIFHWSLVFFFMLAYVSEDDWLGVHVPAGYAVAMLVAFRLMWGLVGTRYARFTQFIRSPSMVLTYCKQMLSFQVPHYLGHNPAAAAMIITLLFSSILVSFSGVVIIASEGQGPLAATVFASFNASLMKEVHEFFANLTLLMVFLHVGGVLFSSLLEGQNLARSMVTGRKKYRSDYVDHKEIHR